MTRKTGLCLAIAAVLSFAAANDAQAGWGSHGGWGSCGSSGGSWGSGGGWGSSGGSYGSGGSHGGILGRIFNRGGSCGSSGGSSGGYSSCGSSGGYAYGSYGSGGYTTYSDGGYYTSTQPIYAQTVVSAAPAVKTQLTLRVPADAKVTLAGVATKQTGEVRQFSTTRLADGQAWQNYQVVVEMDRGGKTVRQERTITLMGGQTQELSISTPEVTLAQATR